MKLVTVVTTVYNCDKFIYDSLLSIKNQSFKNFDWIIINDGSTDNTRNIIESNLDNSITFISHDENKRIPIRRNEAINLSKSKYIAIHDGDDISLPNRLFEQVNFLESNPDYFCVGGWAKIIDKDNKEIGEMNYPPTGYDFVSKMIKTKYFNPIIDPTSMFKREDFTRLGGYSLDKSIFTVPDLDLWCKALLNKRLMANIPKYLIKYRKNPHGMTNLFQKEMIEAHKKVMSDFLRKYKYYE